MSVLHAQNTIVVVPMSDAVSPDGSISGLPLSNDTIVESAPIDTLVAVPQMDSMTSVDTVVALDSVEAVLTKDTVESLALEEKDAPKNIPKTESTHTPDSYGVEGLNGYLFSLNDTLHWEAVIFPFSSFATDGIKLDIRYRGTFMYGDLLATLQGGTHYFGHTYTSYGAGLGFTLHNGTDWSWYSKVSITGYAYEYRETQAPISLYDEPILIKEWAYALYPEIIVGYKIRFINNFTLEGGVDWYGVYEWANETAEGATDRFLFPVVVCVGIGYRF